jgi:malate dehydrogenase (oxaloacetate-decarboxylating)(NADP+)
LCFPYIFRGALDVGATGINDEMKMACVHAIANLARREVTDTGTASEGASMQFGPEYLIPRPFDPRLIAEVAPAVARAAMESGVATRDIEDFDAYVDKLNQFVFRTGLLMKPVFEAARANPKRVVYAEGENDTVLRAVQSVIDDGLAHPILIGRPSVVENRIEKLGLRIKPGEDFELVNPESDPRFQQYWTTYHEITQRAGVSPEAAKAIVRTRPSVIAAVMVHLGEADALITGVVGRYRKKLGYVKSVLGHRPGNQTIAAMSVLTADQGSYFVCDTHVNPDPTAEQIAEITMMAAEKVRLFGIEPKVALLSHSAFGSHDSESACKMQKALGILHEMAPELEVEGEMSADMALSEKYRNAQFPNSRLKGSANLLIMPDLDSAHISFNLSRIIADGVTVGPILLGIGKPAHVLTPAATVRRIINMTAVAVVDAQAEADQQELFAGNGINNGKATDG